MRRDRRPPDVPRVGTALRAVCRRLREAPLPRRPWPGGPPRTRHPHRPGTQHRRRVRPRRMADGGRGARRRPAAGHQLPRPEAGRGRHRASASGAGGAPAGVAGARGHRVWRAATRCCSWPATLSLAVCTCTRWGCWWASPRWSSPRWWKRSGPGASRSASRNLPTGPWNTHSGSSRSSTACSGRSWRPCSGCPTRPACR